jgi:hypothetical protein
MDLIRYSDQDNLNPVLVRELTKPGYPIPYWKVTFSSTVAAKMVLRRFDESCGDRDSWGNSPLRFVKIRRYYIFPKNNLPHDRETRQDQEQYQNRYRDQDQDQDNQSQDQDQDRDLDETAEVQQRDSEGWSTQLPDISDRFWKARRRDVSEVSPSFRITLLVERDKKTESESVGGEESRRESPVSNNNRKNSNNNCNDNRNTSTNSNNNPNQSERGRVMSRNSESGYRQNRRGRGGRRPYDNRRYDRQNDGSEPDSDRDRGWQRGKRDRDQDDWGKNNFKRNNQQSRFDRNRS